jgi:hypothetical protein
MPANSEVQNRLARAVYERTQRAGVTLDASAQDYIGTLIGESAERMEREGALGAEEDVARAEKAFRTLVRVSLSRSPGGL